MSKIHVSPEVGRIISAVVNSDADSFHALSRASGLIDTDFLCDSDFSDVEDPGQDFTDVSIKNSFFCNSLLDQSLFDGTIATGADFSFSSLKGAVFRFCDLSNTIFRHVDLTDAVFERCTVNRADFSGSNVHRDQFTECQLRDLSFFKFQSLAGASSGQTHVRDEWVTEVNSILRKIERDLKRVEPVPEGLGSALANGQRSVRQAAGAPNLADWAAILYYVDQINLQLRQARLDFPNQARDLNLLANLLKKNTVVASG
ncbi:pentapeptide repeat-containing protein [Maricaulis sp.]|uniref:pentapeptide repeat-containing protein n=1 Tax=Maricaulis sp. TaxID=1486257 RepID=UPI003A90D042